MTQSDIEQCRRYIIEQAVEVEALCVHTRANSPEVWIDDAETDIACRCNRAMTVARAVWS